MNVTVSWSARMRTWPLWLRVAVQALLIALVFAAAWLARQPGVWTKVGAAVAICVLVPVIAYGKRAMGLCLSGDAPMRAVERRYKREIMPAATIYMLMAVLLWPLAKHADSVPVKAALALSPVVPTAFMVRAIVRYVMGSDELEQRTHLQALAVAAGVVGMASFTVGVLVTTGVLELGGDALMWVLPVLLVTYGLTRAWVARRYHAE